MPLNKRATGGVDGCGERLPIQGLRKFINVVATIRCIFIALAMAMAKAMSIVILIGLI